MDVYASRVSPGCLSVNALTNGPVSHRVTMKGCFLCGGVSRSIVYVPSDFCVVVSKIYLLGQNRVANLLRAHRLERVYIAGIERYLNSAHPSGQFRRVALNPAGNCGFRFEMVNLIVLSVTPFTWRRSARPDIVCQCLEDFRLRRCLGHVDSMSDLFIVTEESYGSSWIELLDCFFVPERRPVIRYGEYHISARECRNQRFYVTRVGFHYFASIAS